MDTQGCSGLSQVGPRGRSPSRPDPSRSGLSGHHHLCLPYGRSLPLSQIEDLLSTGRPRTVVGPQVLSPFPVARHAGPTRSRRTL